MLTETMESIKDLLESIPNGTFPTPWDDFPNGFETILGIIPDIAKESLAVPKLVIVPDTAGDAIQFQDEDGDRCGGEASYGILVGLLKKQNTRDPLAFDTADWNETKDWLALVESIGSYLTGNEPNGVALARQPELVFLAESDKYQQRVFASWWRLLYG